MVSWFRGAVAEEWRPWPVAVWRLFRLLSRQMSKTFLTVSSRARLSWTSAATPGTQCGITGRAPSAPSLLQRKNHPMRHLLVLLLVLLSGGVFAGEATIATWRGPAYDGVMPAKNLPTSFVWFDQDAPPIGEVGAGMLDPKAGGQSKAVMPHQPGARVNAVWRTELPSWGQSAPIAVGDKVFVTCDAVPGTEGKHVLVCVDIPSGKLDWVRPIDHLLAWKDKTAAAKVQAIRLAEVNGWAEAMRVWNSVWWDNTKYRKYAGADAGQAWGEFQACKEYMKDLHPDRQAAFDAAVAKGYKEIDRGYWRGVGRFGHPEREKQFKEARDTRARIYTHNKEAPWYGSTCGSVVSDGTAVYAVAAPDAMVCYELDGTLRWAADLEVGPRTGGMAGGSHRDMAAPALVDGLVMWHTTVNFTTYAYDCATGRQAWKVQLPAEWYTDGKHPNYPQFKQGVPKHYHAHMGPGGTPVPMMLADKKGGKPVSVIVLSNGHVHRVSDGKVLGWFSTLQPDIANEEGYGSRPQYEIYATAVAKDDVYFSIKATATRLWLEGDSLKSELIWSTPATKKGEKGRGLYSPYHSLILTSQGVLAGDLLVDLATGKPSLSSITRGRSPNGNLSGCISADGLYIWRGEGDQGEKSMRYMIIGLGDVADARATPSARSGFGLIVEGRYSDAVHQRNIDRFGTPRISLGWAHPTASGNRIFVRTHAYLYCFGTGEWKPPGR